MNPIIKQNIDNFEGMVDEVGKIRQYEDLSGLERKFVDSVVALVLELPTLEAKKKLCKIRKFIQEKKFILKQRPLSSAFLNASQGAVDAALYCL